ncbi:N/A [soil metagenome]
MKCFVAGGTGVVGRRAVPALVAAGYDVTVIGRTPERDRLVESFGATPVRIDLFDAAAIAGAIAGHDVVINLATHIPSLSRAASAKAWAENNRIRTEGAANLVAAARRAGAARVIQESITFPYADGGDGWIDEDSDREASEFSGPVDAAEAGVAAFSVEAGAGIVLRFAQFHAPDSHHCQTWAKAFAMRVNPLFGPADSFTSFLGAIAAGRAVVAALDAPAGVYNVADDDPVTRGEAGEVVAAALGKKPPRRIPLPMGAVTKVNPSAEVLTRSQRISNRRFRDATGWAPDHAGADGLAAAIAEIRS